MFGANKTVYRVRYLILSWILFYSFMDFIPSPLIRVQDKILSNEVSKVPIECTFHCQSRQIFIVMAIMHKGI